MLSHPPLPSAADSDNTNIPPHDLSSHHPSANHNHHNHSQHPHQLHQAALYSVAPHLNRPPNAAHHHPFAFSGSQSGFDHLQQQQPSLHHLDPHHPHLHPQQNQTCVPALIPPGMDPSQVDIRTFYPYTPNEVKHRKRTTRAQLKVLEGVYKYDTKPNASLRKKLAAELDMTPRGVQVWFQNRRAKTKQQTKKAEAAIASKSSDSTATAAAASSNPPIAPRPEGDDDDDAEDADEALPASPLPEGTAPENIATADSAPANANASALQDNEQSNSTSDSRRGSFAHPRPGWPPAASPSIASAAPSSSTASSSALSSPSPANNLHVRLSTHPPAATYSHNHLAPTEIYSQRRTSLPPSLHSNGMGAGMVGSLRRRGGYDHNAPRRSTDLGGHRLVAHPYISVAQSANGPHHLYAEGEDGAHPQIRRPMLPQRFTAPFTPSMHSPQPHPHHLHAHSQPVLPSHAAQQRPQLAQRQPYDTSPIPVSLSHSQGYNQPPMHAGYNLFAPRHSIDGSALGLSQAHAQHMSMHMESGGDAFTNMSGYALSQRPAPAPIPGPLPSPNFSFGDPFPGGSLSSSTSNSASGTPPNGASPPLLSLRRTSESGVSDGDTEESSGAPLSRFGSIASIGGSEGSWTSAYVSENGEEGDACASRRLSCASNFLDMFSEMDVGSTGGTPAPHGMPEHQLRHTHSNSHLSPGGYAAHQAQEHSPDGHMHGTSDGDGYPSPSSASTVSAGSNNGGNHTMSQDTTHHQQQHTASGSHIQGQNHLRNTSSELAYALQGEPEPPRAYQQHQQSSPSEDDPSQLQYPMYEQQQQQQTHNGEGDYTYGQDQGHYAKGPVNHFPTLYEGYVYPHSGADGQIPEEEAAMNQQAYAAGAIELGHMCVPASEGVHFMGGYMHQYS